MLRPILVAIVRMPAGCSAFAEIHDVTAKVFGIPVTDDRLPRPAYGSSSPSGDWCGCVHGFFRQITKSDDTHIRRLLILLMSSIFDRKGAKFAE
jgi:hypothetical protein